ncbi:MAG: methylmalonyl-CoA mutase family protein [Gemmatimonadota bacterium]|nr:methylmalonyl-CoA mutase family protein [Gemmatimonadota bacterium]
MTDRGDPTRPEGGSTGERSTTKAEWEERTLESHTRRHPERDARFETTSGGEVEAVYAPSDVDDLELSRIGFPGEPPYVRGIHPNMYRGRLWTMRQYAGFGTAEETNARFRFLLERGQTGLSTAFDLPTQMGYDSDDPLAAAEVGRVGVAIDTLDDMRRLFDSIPLGEVSTSMTINATATTLLGLYALVAEEQGVETKALRGTIQNDILKEYVARGTYIYPPEFSLRLIVDSFEWCAREAPRWNPISISGYHIREAGATAAQEIAFTFANAITYVESAVEAGLDVETFVGRLSFFFGVHNDLFEEVAKFRAARRIWHDLVTDRFGATDPKAARLRFHTQTDGATLTAQQAQVNAVRVSMQALAAVLGGTQSLHTNAYDEALALPTEESAELALRTQQVLAFETGVTKTADPLGGSFYVERLTADLEEAARDYLDRVDDLGGSVAAIEAGFFRGEIEREAYEHQKRVESGEEVVVGVNAFENPDEPEPRIEVVDTDRLAAAQRERLAAWRESRDEPSCREALERLDEAAAGEANLVPLIRDACAAGATVGEIADIFRQRHGTWQDPAAI